MTNNFQRSANAKITRRLRQTAPCAGDWRPLSDGTAVSLSLPALTVNFCLRKQKINPVWSSAIRSFSGKRIGPYARRRRAVEK